MARYTDNDSREESAIREVMSNTGLPKGKAIAVLKSKGVLKQAKGKRGLLVKKKSATAAKRKNKR